MRDSEDVVELISKQSTDSQQHVSLLTNAIAYVWNKHYFKIISAFVDVRLK